MHSTAFHRFTQSLVEGAAADADVLGVVALGSSAATGRSPDAWSDHDMWVIVRDEFAANRLRGDTSWLPDPDGIVGHLWETGHGRSVIYDDGHLLELAIFTVDDLEVVEANEYRVLYDRTDITDRMVSIATRTALERPDGQAVSERATGRFLVQLIIGVNRFGRGELMSANTLVKGWAVAALVTAIGALNTIDNLDPLRRFEAIHPEASRRIDETLREPVPEAAAQLLEIAVDLLDSLPTPLVEAVTSVIRRARRRG